MFLCDSWEDYEVLDTGGGEKLERWGDVILCRPDPQTIWPRQDGALWGKAQAVYHRSERGGGNWEFRAKLPEKWMVRHGELKFWVRPTGFKHTGLFPEQAANWLWMADLIRRPQVSYADTAPFDPERPALSRAVRAQVEIRLKYEGYIKRQLKQVEEFQRMEERPLPPELDYDRIPGLRLEAREKLKKIRPASFGQAGRISGVSPADVSVLMIYLEGRR